ncbi:MAG: NAD(P)H-hydrate epimerase [Firmicutes bacterium]|nr:NAD(P)H-hydrate epimerase [Bacillota bacterium]
MARAVSVETMRQSDAYTIANLVPSKELMYRAGRGIFETVDKYRQETCEKALDGRDVCEDMIAASGMGSCRRWYLSCPYGCAQNNTGWREPVAIAAGKGNNAGDGYVAAGLLSDRGIDVELLLLEEKFSEDGKYYYDECMEAGIPVKMYEPGMDLSGYGTIVDCLLGTGFSGDVREPMASFIRGINAAGDKGTFVVSADLNSGLNGDTGEGSLFVKSDLTVSIGEYKYGHFVGRANEAMKDKANVDIGIEIIGEVKEIL